MRHAPRCSWRHLPSQLFDQSGFKQLAAPGTEEYIVFGRDAGSTIRLGSALFFVWQQQRSDYLPYEGDFARLGETNQIFATEPSNVLLIRATYWFAR